MKTLPFILLTLLTLSPALAQTTHTICQELIELEKLLGGSSLTIEKCETGEVGSKQTTSYFTLKSINKNGVSASSLGVISIKQAQELSNQIVVILNETNRDAVSKGERYEVRIGDAVLIARANPSRNWEYYLDPEREAFGGAIYRLSRKEMEKLAGALVK